MEKGGQLIWDVISAVEYHIDIVKVAGSNPARPTKLWLSDSVEATTGILDR